jgi:hypothetical protein
MFTFGDAATAQNLVGKYDRVALYSADCDFPCPPDIADKWSVGNKRFITFKGDPTASIIDFEPGTRDYQTPDVLRSWLSERAKRIQRHPWVYTDLSNAEEAAYWAGTFPFYWWITTLDNIQRSRAELASLLLDYGVGTVLARAELIAANQWRTPDGGLTDQNVCFTDAAW